MILSFYEKHYNVVVIIYKSFSKDKRMKLQDKANQLRLETFQALFNAGGGHFGGCMSVIEILTALYYGVMKFDANHLDNPNRDRMVLSKGHAGPALYVVLADKGCFEKERLLELDQNGGRLPKHVDRLKVPGIEFSTGPLGQGFSAAAGMALGLKADKSSAMVYAVIGDGECDEGQVWETAMASAHHQLDNLVAIVDRNLCQVDGTTEAVMNLDNGGFSNKWNAFGWNVHEVDGNDAEVLYNTLKVSIASKNGKPSVIIANTTKGKGVPFMEGNYRWHSGKINAEQFEEGMKGLNKIKGSSHV